MNGIYYDEDYNILAKEEVVLRIYQYEKYIVKPTLDSGVGRGIELCTNNDDAEIVLKNHGKNFIVQEVFKQHQTISQFNPSSVNVVRYISVLMNGRVVPVMAALRCGAEGAFNDNSISSDGLGMFVIGIDENGKLKDKVY